jgi:RimJ/RimL family protein N-acetyltransferase
MTPPDLKPDWLTTRRLALRRFTQNDFDFLHGLHTDPLVARWVGGVRTREEVRKILDVRILQYYEDNPGLGIWLTTERATGQAVGLHLINNIQGETDIQVGYILSRDHWSKGYATEMCRALLRYAYADRKLPCVVAITNLENTPSQHVLQKCGLKRNGERAFAHPAYAASGLMAWFESEREAWLAADAQANP